MPPEPPPNDPLPGILIGDNGNNLLLGTDQNDFIQGLGGNDTIIGGQGNDAIFGGSGNNLLFGGDGNDVLDSGRDASVLDGGTGDDMLNIDMTLGANHVVAGGEGADTFNFNNAEAAPSALITVTDFALGVDRFGVDGESDTDVMNSNIGLQVIGNGTLVTLGSGDQILFSGVTIEALSQTYGLNGNNIVSGGFGNDRLFSGDGDAHMNGGAGADTMVSGDGNDVLLGEAGDDYIGSNGGDDFIDGGAGNDQMWGHKGEDTIYGFDGDDMIYSSRNNTIMDGGTGNDFLQARMDKGGDHQLTGGAGADQFDFWLFTAKKGSHNLITDFGANDIVTFNEQSSQSWLQANAVTFSDTEAGARLTLAAGAGSITFAGLDAATVEAMLSYQIIG